MRFKKTAKFKTDFQTLFSCASILRVSKTRLVSKRNFYCSDCILRFTEKCSLASMMSFSNKKHICKFFENTPTSQINYIVIEFISANGEVLKNSLVNWGKFLTQIKFPLAR